MSLQFDVRAALSVKQIHLYPPLVAGCRISLLFSLLVDETWAKPQTQMTFNTFPKMVGGTLNDNTNTRLRRSYLGYFSLIFSQWEEVEKSQPSDWLKVNNVNEGFVLSWYSLIHLCKF